MPIDDFWPEVIASFGTQGPDTEGMSAHQPQPQRLKPRGPPGHGRRKALRYVNELHRLRTEGHSLESIRLALNDAGVSVSLSTVRREVNRPPSTWEPERDPEVALALEELLATWQMTDSAPALQSLDASSERQVSPDEAELATAKVEVISAPMTGGLLSRFLGVLRRLGQT